MKSSHARRKGTGRKPHPTKIRQKPVHPHRYRRYGGVRTAPLGQKARNSARAKLMNAARRAAQGMPNRIAMSAARRAMLRSAALRRAGSLRSAARLAALARARAALKGRKLNSAQLAAARRNLTKGRHVITAKKTASSRANAAKARHVKSTKRTAAARRNARIKTAKKSASARQNLLKARHVHTATRKAAAAANLAKARAAMHKKSAAKKKAQPGLNSSAAGAISAQSYINMF